MEHAQESRASLQSFGANYAGQYTQEMKNPALTGGVSLQFKLRLTRLLLALVPDILPNRGFIDANRGGEKSSCPDAPSIPLHLC